MRSLLTTAVAALAVLAVGYVAGSPAEPTAPPLRPGVMALDFARLASFQYGDALPRLSGEIPASVRALDGERVRLMGHPFALTTDEPHRTRFALSRTSPDCCFGRMPMITEWVLVGGPATVRPPEDALRTIWVTGVLRVGEVRDAGGEVLAIYSMEAEAVE